MRKRLVVIATCLIELIGQAAGIGSAPRRGPTEARPYNSGESQSFSKNKLAGTSLVQRISNMLQQQKLQLVGCLGATFAVIAVS